jgi:hypothetical protein
MKKLTIAILMLMGTYSIASAELGVNIGVSGNLGVFHATGTETDVGLNKTETETEDATGVAGYSSIFLEKTLGSRITLGVDYVPQSLESETAENQRLDGALATRAGTVVDNTIKISFEDLTTYYVALNITEGMYVKAGVGTVDVITKESLGTGSDYGNTSMDFDMWGVGAQKTFDSGFFMRVEAQHMDFDNVTVASTTNANNSVAIKDMEGGSGKISLGKSF